VVVVVVVAVVAAGAVPDEIGTGVAVATGAAVDVVPENDRPV
jgi:hypothetical protein